MTVEITMEPTATLEVTFEGSPTIEVGVPPLGDALDALAAVSAEATTRAAGDANLQGQIDALSAAGGVLTVEGVAPDGTGNVDLNLGTAATHAATDFDSAGAAAAAQTAAEAYTDTAIAGLGSGDVATVDGIAPDGTGNVDLGLATVARSGDYADLIGTPTLGTAAAASTGDFDAAGSAAAAQAAAISASQPVDGDLSAIAALTTTDYGRAFLTLANQGSLMALLGSASDTAQGIVELATNTEALTGTDTVRAVTPAGVKAVIDALINSAPGTLDTLGEIAAQLASDESAVSALTTTVAGKLAKASNLSDLLDVSVARTNLGLGDIATHSVSEFQPADGDLTAIAALTTTAFGRSLLTSADAAALRTAAALGNSATRDVGTTAGTVAAGDDSRITGAAQKASNLSDLASASTARTNLGLGTAAVLNVPASGNAASGEVVKGSDGRLTDSRTPTAHAAAHGSAGSDPITIAESQVTGLTTDLAAKAPLASPAFTGNPTAPTPTAGDNDTSIATTAFVTAAVAAGGGGGGGSTLDPFFLMGA